MINQNKDKPAGRPLLIKSESDNSVERYHNLTQSQSKIESKGDTTVDMTSVTINNNDPSMSFTKIMDSPLEEINTENKLKESLMQDINKMECSKSFKNDSMPIIHKFEESNIMPKMRT